VVAIRVRALCVVVWREREIEWRRGGGEHKRRDARVRETRVEL
jgi:hypothetical protein